MAQVAHSRAVTAHRETAARVATHHHREAQAARSSAHRNQPVRRVAVAGATLLLPGRATPQDRVPDPTLHPAAQAGPPQGATAPHGQVPAAHREAAQPGALHLAGLQAPPAAHRPHQTAGLQADVVRE